MNPSKRFWIASFCAVVCLLGVVRWLHTRPIYAQGNGNVYDDGTFYIYAGVDVDSSYILDVESYMEVEYDYYEDIDEIVVDGYADRDGQYIGGDSDDGDDYNPAGFDLQSNAPVSTGHEYGMESDGYAYFDDGEGDGEWDYVGTAYTSVNVASQPPQITSLSTYSVAQGDQGTLTITGTHLVQGSADQLTLNFSGSSNPFTLVGTPSTTTASFTYDFTAYAAGTYTLSVTNNQGTSNNESFTVVASAPSSASSGPSPDPCAVGSDPQTGSTSIVSTGLVGGSGSVSVSFGGAAFAAVSASVTYGPNSTPSSIAANIAALITKNYFRHGLTARAFGPSIVYSGNATLGAVINVTTGPSFGTDSSAAAADGAGSACESSGENLYYNIQYRAFIPVDNLPGPSPCTVGPYYIPNLDGLDYLGDTSSFSATKYRLQETTYASTSPSSSAIEIPPLAAAGKTVNFATSLYTIIGGPPLSAITRAQFLEPDPTDTTANPGTRANPTHPWEYQCNQPYENAFGYADLSQVGGTSSSTSANSVTTEFKGLASDPLEPPVGGINWDLTVSVNTSNNTATISGWNTCYPAHQIRVNGVLIYDSQPAQNKTSYLAGCLSSAVLGSANPTLRHISSCTVSLNTSQPCIPQ